MCSGVTRHVLRTVSGADTPETFHATQKVVFDWEGGFGRNVHGELVDVIFAREQRLPLKHLGENTSCAPYVNLDVVLLPREHDFRGAVVSC